MDRTNTLLARVLADLEQLKAWAEADRGQSMDAGAEAQADDDDARVQMLGEALDIVAGCRR